MINKTGMEMQLWSLIIIVISIIILLIFFVFIRSGTLQIGGLFEPIFGAPQNLSG